MPFFLILPLIVIAVVAALIAAYALLLKYLYRIPARADEIFAVTTPDHWKVRLFRHRPNSAGAEPVLLVPGVTANHHEFEFPRRDSLADTLVDNGYDVWILDPRGRRSSTPPKDNNRSPVIADDYLIQDLPAAVDFIRAVTRYENVHYIGHSLGGMLLYAYDAAYGRANIASAVTLGAPPGFKYVPYRSPKNLLFAAKTARPVVEFVGRCLAPLAHVFRIKSRVLPLNWSNLHPDVGGRETYHILEVPPPRVLQDLDEWAHDKVWRMHADEVDVLEGLRELEIPLFAIFGAQDPFTPRVACDTFFEELDLPDKRMLILSRRNGHSADYSHIDLVLGRHSREEVFEPIVQWLQEHKTTERLRPIATVSRIEFETITSIPMLVIDIPEPKEYPEDLNIPVLPGSSNAELARLARALREDASPKARAKKAPVAKKKAPAKPPAKKAPVAKKKAAAKPPAKKAPVAKKKPAAKRKPKG